MLASAGITSYADTDEEGGGGSVAGWVAVSDNISTDPATNNIVYTTVDQERTSNTFYHTIGYTISDAYVGTDGKLHETGLGEITVYLNQKQYVEYENNAVGGQVAMNQWTLKYDAILEGIRQQGVATNNQGLLQWYAKLEAESTTETLALNLDPVITLTINNKKLVNTDEYTIDPLTGEKVYKDIEVNKYNIAEYAKLYSWLNKFAVKKFDRGLIK